MLAIKKAGEICPNGYNIIDRSTGTVGIPTAYGRNNDGPTIRAGN